MTAPAPIAVRMTGISKSFGGIRALEIPESGMAAAKKIVPASAGTFPTHGGVFVGLVVGVILIIGGLTFFPALALGPIVEHLAIGQQAVDRLDDRGLACREHLLLERLFGRGHWVRAHGVTLYARRSGCDCRVTF